MDDFPLYADYYLDSKEGKLYSSLESARMQGCIDSELIPLVEYTSLSKNVWMNDDLDILTAYGVKLTGALLRALTTSTPSGVWFRVEKSEADGKMTIHMRTDLVPDKKEPETPVEIKKRINELQMEMQRLAWKITGDPAGGIGESHSARECFGQCPEHYKGT